MVVLSRARAPLAVLALVVMSGCVSAEGDVLVRAGDGGAPVDAPGARDAAIDAAGSCELDGPCPLPPVGDVTVCGRVLDLETSSPVAAASMPDVVVFDFVELLMDPIGAVAELTVEPDECGWFHTTIDDFLGIFVIATGTLSSADFARTGAVITTGPGQVVRTNAYVLRADTAAAWSQGAGLGTDGLDGGAALAIFVDANAPPAAGLQGAPVGGVTFEPGTTGVGDAHYFDDSDPAARTSIAPAATVTGANGSVLFVGPPSAATLGGQHPSCTFPSTTALLVPEFVQVQEIAGGCQ